MKSKQLLYYLPTVVVFVGVFAYFYYNSTLRFAWVMATLAGIIAYNVGDYLLELREKKEQTEKVEEPTEVINDDKKESLAMIDYYDSLLKLNELKEKGVLTDSEFQSEKEKILSGKVPHNNVNNASPSAQQPLVITNTNTNTNINTLAETKNKWIAFFLCLFLGIVGAHKFYEGKILLGIFYICTGGLLGIGVIVDLIALLFKPNPYYC